jgi:3' terminal RNA ribose 2'-O-methyltransferase Hen1
MDDDVDKLLRYGDGWLDTHPQKEWIVKRYVGYKKGLVKNALAELVTETAESTEQTDEKKDETVVAKTPLGKLRYSAFADLIAKRGITEVVDMGAGEGRLLELLVQNKNLKTILACEPTEMGLLKMRRNFEIWERKGRVKVNPEIIQSSLFYVDERLVGKECLALCEVIEHIDIDRIDDVMSIVLSKYAPKTFLMSTPNIEYNVVYELEGFRHSDHRFEMTRTEFETFCQKHASSHGYEVSFTGIGDTHETLGQPTQLAIFTASN